VDGPKDMRFAMTARTVARLEKNGKELNELTMKNVAKVTRYRDGGEAALREIVDKVSTLEIDTKLREEGEEKRWGGDI
jgi:large subunit ribosomal protein L17